MSERDLAEILVKFWYGPHDGHFIPLPDHWDADEPPEVVWLVTDYDQARNRSHYWLLDEPPGCAYRYCGENSDDISVVNARPSELHYERFEQADEAADLHSG